MDVDVKKKGASELDDVDVGLVRPNGDDRLVRIWQMPKLRTSTFTLRDA